MTENLISDDWIDTYRPRRKKVNNVSLNFIKTVVRKHGLKENNGNDIEPGQHISLLYEFIKAEYNKTLKQYGGFDSLQLKDSNVNSMKEMFHFIFLVRIATYRLRKRIYNYVIARGDYYHSKFAVSAINEMVTYTNLNK